MPYLLEIPVGQFRQNHLYIKVMKAILLVCENESNQTHLMNRRILSNLQYVQFSHDDLNYINTYIYQP